MQKFSVQQYTFRPLSNQLGLIPMLEKIAAMGYTGVELCCFGGFDSLEMSAAAFRRQLEALGIEVVGNHFTREMFLGDHEEAFSYIAEAGGRYAVYNIWAPYDSADQVRRAAEYLNELSRITQRCGITLAYHNHAAEFATIDGKFIIDLLDQHLDPQVCFETDVYFARQQIDDVCAYLKQNCHRVRLVHLKQMAPDGSNTDLPDGIIDMTAVVQSASTATDFILEQSTFPVSIQESLQRNADFLKQL